MVHGLCSSSVISFPNSLISDRVVEDFVCVCCNWVGGYMRCVLVVLEGGINFLLCGENSTCMLEGFFDYSREWFVYLFEFFLGYDRGLVMILDSVDYGYVILVELLRYFMDFNFFFSRERGTVWVGAPLYFEQGLLGKEGFISSVDMDFKFSFKKEEGCGYGGSGYPCGTLKCC